MTGKKNKTYDLVIVGSGPAGLTAALYAARYKVDTLVLGKVRGGLVSETSLICNFPSYQGIKGNELVKKMAEQVECLDVEIKAEEVLEIKNETKTGKTFFSIKTEGGEYKARKIILTTGMKRKNLDIPGEREFAGRGVSYCVNCDGPFFKDKTVAVVGGGNAAVTTALLLTEYAKQAYIIYRGNEFFRVEPTLLEQVKRNKKIQIILNSSITEILGKDRVEEIKLDSGKSMKINGIFVEIGSVLDKKLINNLNLKTKEGFVVADNNQKTSVKGVFSAGDINNSVLKQIITACAEGAIAATSVYEELRNEKNEN